MKIFKNLLVLIVGALILGSCGEEDHFIDNVENSPNIADFENHSKSVSKISTGEEYEIQIPMKVEGPSVRDLSGDVTVTVEVAFESPGDTIAIDSENEQRAVEGTHYRIDQNQITLKESDNYLGNFTFTMLTDGLLAPVEPTPKLLLKVTDASGVANVINSGKPIEVALNYACDSNLQGTYDVVTSVGSTVVEHKNEVVVAREGLGEYTTGSVGFFWTEPGSPIRPGDIAEYGVKFSDVCGNLTVEETILGGIYSNPVTGTEKTKVDGNSQTGETPLSFTLKYNIDGLGDYESVYTKKD